MTWSLGRTLVLAWVAIGAAATQARADDDPMAQCIAASDKGLDLRKQGKLIEARGVLATCATPACGADISGVCQERLADISARLPTIEFLPKDGAGHDIVGVKLYIDGASVGETLDGRPVPLDPGPHTFKFEVAGQSPVEQSFVLVEGTKDRRERIDIGPSPMAAPAAGYPPVAPVVARPPAPVSGVPKTVGIVVGGAGVVGVAVGSIFGLMASSSWSASKSDCGSPTTCPRYAQAVTEHDSAVSQGTVSTVAFVAGGAVLATGVVLFLTAPRPSRSPESDGSGLASGAERRARRRVRLNPRSVLMKLRAQRPATLAVFTALVLACGSSNSPTEVTDATDLPEARPDARSHHDAAPRGDAGTDAADSAIEADHLPDSTDDGETATTVDASPDSSSCSSDQLWCGGICVPNDYVNCGTCGNDCTNLHATSTPSCKAGQCAFPGLTCAAGWGHCTSRAADGCESNLSQPTHCGGCNTQCVAMPVCAESAGAFSCAKVVAAAIGYDFTLAVLSNGALDSWGNNWGGRDAIAFGQLGNGTNEESSSVPGPVSNTSTATAVAAGDGHACALLSNRTVECWGDNEWGQLGADPQPDGGIGAAFTPIAVAGLSNVTAIAAGAVHTCALISGGTVECWGYNGDGELGNATSTLCNGFDKCSSTPAPVSGLSGVMAIAIGAEHGANHTCALLGNGSVECWGYDGDGELGNGTVTVTSPYGSATPGLVSNVTTAISITALGEAACALLSGGSVKCWGNNDNGELGDGTTNASPIPVAVSKLTDAVALSVGSTAAPCVPCARAAPACCWGRSGNGELGAGSRKLTSSRPLAISGSKNIAAIATGAANACAVLTTGDVECWGFDGDGELANTTANPNFNPIPLPVQW